MAAGVPARLSAAEGRRFGFTVGFAFLALAGVAAWRGRGLTAWICAIAGGALVVGGLLLPTWLGPVQRAWMALAAALSRVTTPAVTALIYFVLMTPMGFFLRLGGHNSLTRGQATGSLWVARRPDARRRVDMEHQF